MAVSTASLIFTGGIGATAVSLGFTKVLVGGLVFAGVSGVVANALGLKPKIPSISLSGSGLTNSIDPIADFELVYGETRKGGIKTFLDVTENNKYMHKIVKIVFLISLKKLFLIQAANPTVPGGGGKFGWFPGK